MVSRMVATGGDAAPSFYEGLGRHNSKCAKNGTSGGKGDALQSYVDALGASQETCYAVTASPGHSSAHCWPFAAIEWPHLAPKLAGLVSCVRFDTLTTSRAVQGLLWSLISY